MSLKRATYTIGALASAALIALSVPGSASATAGFGHAWNDSPSTNECLATSGGVVGNPAIMWTCDSESGQQWQVQPISGTNSLNTLRTPDGGCLDTMGSGPGARIYVYACNGGAHQQWIDINPNGSYAEWANPTSGQCLSVSGGSTANGAAVISWTCQGTLDQLWGGFLV